MNFELIWSKYPKKLGMKAAKKHFNATVKTVGDFNRITVALANYLAHIKITCKEYKYIQYGSTWFNNWEDWVDYKEVPSGGRKEAYTDSSGKYKKFG